MFKEEVSFQITFSQAYGWYQNCFPNVTQATCLILHKHFHGIKYRHTNISVDFSFRLSQRLKQFFLLCGIQNLKLLFYCLWHSTSKTNILLYWCLKDRHLLKHPSTVQENSGNYFHWHNREIQFLAWQHRTSFLISVGTGQMGEWESVSKETVWVNRWIIDIHIKLKVCLLYTHKSLNCFVSMFMVKQNTIKK